MTKLYDLFSQTDLQAQLDAKMVKATAHPTFPLAILNYTPQATFTPELWNHVTDLCRGLVYDVDTLEVIARPFAKFWNYGDSRHPETLPENFPASTPTITRKLDGSLGITYPTPRGWAITTRGSFASDQAMWASRWLSSHPIRAFVEGYTPLFEIIYPENQIVVRYAWQGLMLLALVNIATGEELNRKGLEQFAAANEYELAPVFDKPLSSLAAEDEANEEGYVAAWERVGLPPLRCKVKYATYCRLHKLLTQTNAVTVWEMLRDGQEIDELVVDVPQEFRLWLEGVRAKLGAAYKALEDWALEAMAVYPGEKRAGLTEDRKKFALYAVQQQPVTPILFAMLDGKNYASIIWKMIRPRGDEKAFKEADE